MVLFMFLLSLSLSFPKASSSSSSSSSSSFFLASLLTRKKKKGQKEAFSKKGWLVAASHVDIALCYIRI